MDILKIIILSIITVMLIIITNKESKEQAIFIKIAFSILIVTILLGKIKNIYDDLKIIFESNYIDVNYIKVIIKVIVIAYLSEFTSDISKDAGENTIANNTLLAGKVLILYISSPIFLEIIKKITTIV